MNEKYPCDDVSSIVLFLVVLGCFCWLLSVTGCRNSNGLQGSADREIGRIEEQQRQAGAEISRAGAEIESAEDTIGRADRAVSNSQKRAASVQAGIKECQELARECQGLARANAKIIAELGKDD